MVIIFTVYSVSVLKNDLPIFSTQLARFIQDSIKTPTAILLLSGLLFFILYLNGTYRQNANLSFIKHLSIISTAVLLTYAILFIQFFGFLTLFSFQNVWTTFIKLVAINIVGLTIPHTVIIITLRTLIKKGYWTFDTILIGTSNNLKNSHDEIVQLSKASGHKIKQILCIDNTKINGLDKEQPHLSNYEEIDTYLEKTKPDEIIIALSNDENKLILKFLSVAKMRNITVRLIPDLSAILKGFVTLDNPSAQPYITISNKTLPVWQSFVKRCSDICIALIGIVSVLPLIPYIIFRIKKESHGPIFYKQERIGKNGKAFKILKFRTMYQDAEKNGPSLSSSHDDRITPFGKTLRRWRIDELPQFINVILGNMAIVGPRPERSHYINEISKEAPHFSQILHIRPGITSLGMVKFGYAENVQQMIQRLEFDIIYMENLSLWLDLKILLYTIRTLLSGEGK
ncbi:sugar transferase [Carboxylicivirga sp. N1Y90]|uniref:sugar transferase n=1 Tax=Carboxylicivirga fragile TaxID=3417571 RepID=UPI003D33D196|nr:sugar transferase [Marinilabiliaceae bacterium N1Y90]